MITTASSREKPRAGEHIAGRITPRFRASRPHCSAQDNVPVNHPCSSYQENIFACK